ncbi:MAG TPA: hypothetical protein VG892_09085, partial [Terriglobales bacterium]|nr:hypothetical protein [Terriglobales bacterium]
MGKRQLIWKRLIATLAVGIGAWLLVAPGFAAAQDEWLTWGYDQERTGWNRSENVLNKDNVSQLQLKWKVQLTGPQEMVLSTLTSPLVARVNGPQGSRDLVYMAGSDDTIYAIDAEVGEIVWQKQFKNPVAAKDKATFQCGNSLNA